MRWFAQRASRGPMVVVTGYGIGLPNDMVWLALQDKPNVQMYWDNQFPPLQPVHPKTDMYLLGRDRWGSSTREPTELPANEPIFMLVPRIRDDASGITEEIVHWKDLPGHARPVKVFLNPPGQDGSVMQLVVLEVPPRERRVAKKDAPGETETAMLR